MIVTQHKALAVADLYSKNFDAPPPLPTNFDQFHIFMLFLLKFGQTIAWHLPPPPHRLGLVPSPLWEILDLPLVRSCVVREIDTTSISG